MRQNVLFIRDYFIIDTECFYNAIIYSFYRNMIFISGLFLKNISSFQNINSMTENTLVIKNTTIINSSGTFIYSKLYSTICLLHINFQACKDSEAIIKLDFDNIFALQNALFSNVDSPSIFFGVNLNILSFYFMSKRFRFR